MGGDIALKHQVDPAEKGMLNILDAENNTVFSIHYLRCCGVRELHNLRAATEYVGYENIARKIASLIEDKVFNCAYILFTGVQPESRYHGGTYGDGFQDFILANRLGTVMASTKGTNPNSGNVLKVYLWQLDHAALKARYQTEPVQAPML